MMKFVIFCSLFFSFSHLVAETKKNQFESLELFSKVLNLVETQYYRPVDREILIEGALKGMMETLDPHSLFLNKEYFEKMQNDTQGEFGGLGLEVTQKDGVIIIISPLEDTPASRAGIKPKDKIVEINHEPVVGMSLEQAIDRMKGKIGQKIHLGIAREGKDKTVHFNLKRELIKVKSVKSELLADQIGYIKLTQFQKTSAELVEKALVDLTKKSSGKLRGIIFDLRSNPGGLLDQAVDISSFFLKDGIVVTTESREPQNKDIRYVKKSGFKNLSTPMIVMINGASASASEIVAGALQDYKRAKIFGTTSFGKGSVQTIAQIDKDTGVKLTIAQYMTPLNRKIQAVGIKPDISVDALLKNDPVKGLEEDKFLREKDLRNHLTATIESLEEKKEREEIEKKERLLRISRIESKKKVEVKKVEEDDDKILEPKNDEQVQLVRNLLLKGL